MTSSATGRILHVPAALSYGRPRKRCRRASCETRQACRATQKTAQSSPSYIASLEASVDRGAPAWSRTGRRRSPEALFACALDSTQTSPAFVPEPAGGPRKAKTALPSLGESANCLGTWVTLRHFVDLIDDSFDLGAALKVAGLDLRQGTMSNLDIVAQVSKGPLPSS